MARLTNAVASAIAQFQAGQPQSSSHHSSLPASSTAASVVQMHKIRERYNLLY